MNKVLAIISFVVCAQLSAQSYAPAANEVGTDAIYKDSSAIVAWATDIDLTRGYLDIQDTNYAINGNNKVSYGDRTNALYYAEGNHTSIVSLGDGGVATLHFDWPIINGPGADFAVFENSFDHQYLELAFVEVSSDGINFVRFSNHSETQTVTQVSGFGYLQAERLHNLAGKYKGGYGTPFDLQELTDSLTIDINNIRHVRIIDVIGSIGESASFDSHGNKINDPYPTNYATGGFDLDGVGVLHQLVGIKDLNSENEIVAYPNPFQDILNIDNMGEVIQIFSLSGKLMVETSHSNGFIDTSSWSSGVYLLKTESVTLRLVKL